MKYAHINGTIVEHAQASLYISDLGLRRGYGVFEFSEFCGGFRSFWKTTWSALRILPGFWSSRYPTAAIRSRALFWS